MERIIYYEDLLNDDFSITNIEKKPLPKKFKYVNNNIIWRLWAFIFYFFFAKPIFYIVLKITYRQRIKNRRLIYKANKTGCYIYGNHTQGLIDAFTPSFLNPFHKNYVVVGLETTSIHPFVTSIVMMLGSLPLGDTLEHKKDMLKCFKKRISQKCSITIYPEAHIWPYYNKIRPFKDDSFKYPVKENVPVYALTNCYKKRKFSKMPKVITFLDGPYYPKEELSGKENQKYLRDLVYNKMVERTEKYSTYEYIKYIKKESKEESNTEEK